MYPDSPRVTAITTFSLGILIILQLLSLSRPTMQAVLQQSANYYKAGVVEFKPHWPLTDENSLEDNLAGYLRILYSPEVRNLDIVVFPESTLNNRNELTIVPNPAVNQTAPCDFANNNANSQFHEFLIEISCAARNTSTYVVINIKEKEPCSPDSPKANCQPNKPNIYNTNVVFDRDGRVISRYRKFHPFRENVNRTEVAEFGYFDTDFGVRFGHFICFDILFYTPAQEMVERLGIKDFVYPTMWFSQLPFLTAIQTQFAWSYANNVNLLSAGASNPKLGSSGTGIFNGQNGIITAKMTISGDGEQILYTGLVPKHGITQSHPLQPNQQPAVQRNIHLLRDRVQNYITEEINLLTANSTLDKKLCSAQNSFCCYFSLEWEGSANLNSNIISTNNDGDIKQYHYRMAVFDGLRDNATDIDLNYIKNCAIFTCTDNTIGSCGTVFNESFGGSEFVNWKRITIAAKYPKVKQFLLMPNTLTDNQLMPLHPDSFDWRLNSAGEYYEARLSLKTPVDDLLTFAIYGNYYDGAAASLQVSLLLFTLAALFNYFFTFFNNNIGW